MVLVGVLGLQILRPAFQSSARHSARAEMQQQAGDALDRMVIDLERSTLSGVALLPGSSTTPSGLAFQRLEGFESSGSQRFETQLRVYAWSPNVGTLQYFTWQQGQAPALTYNPSLDTASKLTRTDFDILMNNPPRRVFPLVTGVSAWTMTQAGNAVKLTLVLKRETPGPPLTPTPTAADPNPRPLRHFEEFTISRNVALPNGA